MPPHGPKEALACPLALTPHRFHHHRRRNNRYVLMSLSDNGRKTPLGDRTGPSMGVGSVVVANPASQIWSLPFEGKRRGICHLLLGLQWFWSGIACSYPRS